MSSLHSRVIFNNSLNTQERTIIDELFKNLKARGKVNELKNYMLSLELEDLTSIWDEVEVRVKIRYNEASINNYFNEIIVKLKEGEIYDFQGIIFFEEYLQMNIKAEDYNFHMWEDFSGDKKYRLRLSCTFIPK